MAKVISLSNLEIEKAHNADWELILELLVETNLTQWFTGKERCEDFYLVKNKDLKELIACFAIACENSIGILKSFAVKNNMQKKGIGKFVLSKVPDFAKKLGVKRLYAISDIAGFWRKTYFTEIKYSDIKDQMVLEYLNPYIKRIENYFSIAHFFIYKVPESPLKTNSLG